MFAASRVNGVGPTVGASSPRVDSRQRMRPAGASNGREHGDEATSRKNSGLHATRSESSGSGG